MSGHSPCGTAVHKFSGRPRGQLNMQPRLPPGCRHREVPFDNRPPTRSGALSDCRLGRVLGRSEPDDLCGPALAASTARSLERLGRGPIRSAPDPRLRPGLAPPVADLPAGSAFSGPTMANTLTPDRDDTDHDLSRSCGGDMATPQKCLPARHDLQTTSDSRH